MTAAVVSRGWFIRHRWLLLRRLSQLGILTLFLLGPWFGLWVVKGNLNFSYTLDTLPLSDPYVLLQSLLAGHWQPETKLLLGAAIVLAFYLVAGGRVYCAWVCPLNLVTDAAAWLRRRLGIKGSIHVSRKVRYWLLALTLALAAGTGMLVWELVNPVSILHRGLIFGLGAGWTVIAAVFLFDLLVMQRGWCGHLCPVGAFYSVVGMRSVVRVSAAARAQCDDCMDCFVVCPEPQVIKAPLKVIAASPVIVSPNCTNCGRCIDVCSKSVFAFGTRFQRPPSPSDTGLTSTHP
jgi:ferredoxin-type protein NapH